MKTKLRIIIGIIAFIAGLRTLDIYHYMLWSSGGPDHPSRDQIQYIVPYFITSATATLGLMWALSGIKELLKSNK